MSRFFVSNSRRSFLRDATIATAAVATTAGLPGICLAKPKAKKANQVKTISLDGIRPAPHVRGGVLVQLDKNYVVFDAVQRSRRSSSSGKAVVRLDDCLSWRFNPFGALNTDTLLPALPDLHRFDTFEVLNSTWVQQLLAEYEENPIVAATDFYHFVFTFAGTIFECVTNDLTARLEQKSFADIFAA